MTPNTTESPTSVAMPDTHALTTRPPVPSRSSSPPVGETYWRVARMCEPRLLNLLRADSSGLPESRMPRSDAALEHLHRRLQVALALVLLDEYDSANAAKGAWRAAVFQVLLDWQFTMRYDGVPRARNLRGHGAIPLMADLVVQIVTEAREYRSPQLLSDVAAHLEWLAGRRDYEPAQETALLCALIDGAVIVRKKGLLTEARHRLGRLLNGQHPAGWFPTRYGWDLPEHVDVVDRLARIGDSLDDPAMRSAIECGLSLLARCSTGDGMLVGPSRSTWQTPFSPVALVLTGNHSAVAATLAYHNRRATDALTAQVWESMLDRDVARCAVRYARAAARTRATTSAHDAAADAGPDHPRQRLTEDGLLIHSGDGYRLVASLGHGGALRIDWQDGRSPLEDLGVNVVQFGRTMVSGAWSCVERIRLHEDGFTIRGWLTDPHLRHNPFMPVGKNRAAEFAKALAPLADSQPGDQLKIRPARGNRFQRRVTFGIASITITDLIYCRRPFELAAVREFHPQSFNSDIAHGCPSPPVVVEGGRIARIRRTHRSEASVPTDVRSACR